MKPDIALMLPRKQKFNRLKIFWVILLVLGVSFRFVNLDRKVYWRDEVYTSLRIAGYTTGELVGEVADGHVISIEDLHKFQRINPDKGVTDTVMGLMLEEPQLTPLYFVIARLWGQCLGSSEQG
ncbi:MAG TPA: hypothetical protein DDZ80_05670 [Cyanobacteria bacterium UBA8803]|nr:hypothetical protein [Cyanobacteria bacterium UBA9273]HBL58025.1 hypothetical protein [Cyanobacteria bacterium UBA8803]